MRRLFAIACTLASVPASAQPLVPDAELWMYDYNVLTMSVRGDWGVGVGPTFEHAIKTAIDNCRKMSGATSAVDGCGAYSATVRVGWALGIRCGKHNILVA